MESRQQVVEFPCIQGQTKWEITNMAARPERWRSKAAHQTQGEHQRLRMEPGLKEAVARYSRSGCTSRQHERETGESHRHRPVSFQVGWKWISRASVCPPVSVRYC